MPVMKPVACHTPSCRRSVDYAAGPDNPKVAARDYMNCCERDALGRDAWAQLDATRKAHGADRPRMRVRKDDEGNPVLDADGNPVRYDSTIYYEHFILSPDPRDRATLEQVRAVATEWVEGEFPGFEAVIGYHRDTGIPHAHAIVNGVSVDGATRIHDITRKSKWCRDAWGRLQDIARAHGLSGFNDTVAEREARGERARGAQAHADDRAERAMDARGAYSWVSDIRARADCAARVSADVEGFREALAALGVSLEPASRGGDWKYVMDDAPTHQATGRRLGEQWTEFGVGRRLARERAAGAAKPQGEAREALLSALSSLVAGGAQEVRVVGTVAHVEDPAARLARLRDVSKALAWAQANGVESQADAERAARPGDRRAADMAGLLRSLGYLPLETDCPRRGRGDKAGWRQVAPGAHARAAVREDARQEQDDQDESMDEGLEMAPGQGRTM